MKRLYITLLLTVSLLAPTHTLWSEESAGQDLCHEQIELYKTAINADVHDEASWTKFRACVVTLKHWNEAGQVATAALEKDPNLWQAHLLNGISLLHLKDYVKARDALTKASQLQSEQSLPFYYLGMTYLFMHDSESAVEAGQKAVSLDPKNPANYRQLAYAYLFLDAREECESTAKKAIELDPNDTAAFKVLSTLYAREGRQEESDQMGEAAIHANGRTTVAHPLSPAAIASLPGITAPPPAAHPSGTAAPAKPHAVPNPAVPKTDAIAACTAQWHTMIDAIVRGDIDRALTYFSSYADTRQKYQESFQKLGPSRLQQIFSGFGDPTDCNRIIGIVDCKATLTHPGAPGTMINSEATLRFERNEDGVWRIQSF